MCFEFSVTARSPIPGTERSEPLPSALTLVILVVRTWISDLVDDIDLIVRVMNISEVLLFVVCV